MEPMFIASSISKVVTSALAKAFGGMASSWTSKRELKRALHDTGSSFSNSVDIKMIEKLEPEPLRELAKFVESAEFDAVVVRIATLQFTERTSKKRKRASEIITGELSELIRLHVNGVPDELASRIALTLIEASLQQITLCLGDSQLGKYLPVPSVKELTRVSASIDAMSRRNCELLSTISSLRAYHDLTSELRHQIAQVHGKLRLPHPGPIRLVPHDQLYIKLTLKNQTNSELGREISVLVDELAHIVLLGDPGGGKSTVATRLALDITRGNAPISIGERVPFILVLREYAQITAGSRIGIAEYIEYLCRDPYNVDPPDGWIDYLLINGRALLVFDGLDELTDLSLRQRIVDNIHGFVHRYPTVPILVTSRRVGYEEVPLDSDLFSRVELGEFGREQVADYASRWFHLDDTLQPREKRSLATAFMRDSDYVADIRSNPLLLSLMCSIYSSEGYIPANRPEVFEKCSSLLFDRWDKQRKIVKPLQFDAHVKYSVWALALWFLRNPSQANGFSRDNLVAFMRDYLLNRRFETEEEAENAASDFVDFCTGRAWVLTDVGSDPRQPLYGFTHRTFLEYFAARQLCREMPLPEVLFEELGPLLENAQWDVVAQICVQVLSQSVEDGADKFLQLLLERVAQLRAQNQHSASFNLLSFAARCTEFVVPDRQILRRITECAFEEFSTDQARADEFEGNSKLEIPLRSCMLGSTENLDIVNRTLRTALENLGSDLPSERVAALAFYPWSLPAYTQPRGPSVRFWRTAYHDLELVRNRFRTALSEKIFWIRLDEALCDHRPLAHILNDSTKRSFFSSQFISGFSRPSVVASLLRLYLAPDHFIDDAPNVQVSVVTGENFCADLTRSLMELQTPWHELSSDSSSMLHYLSYFIPNEGTFAMPAPHLAPVIILLGMFYADYSAAWESQPAASNGIISTSKDWWECGIGRYYDDSTLVNLLSPELLNLFQRWRTGKISFCH